MKYAVLRGDGLRGDIIFDRQSQANRDDCFAPYVLLKEALHKYGIQINTPDCSRNNELAFEIHQDFQNQSNSQNNYLMMFETDFIKKQNSNADNLKKYRKIFTWRDDLVDGKRFIKFNFPNPIKINLVDGFKNRQNFCCLIAGNKTILTRSSQNLYQERVKTIRWFEKNEPQDFCLYGTGWNMPASHRGIFGKLERVFYKCINRFIVLEPFPSYRGRVANKSEVLRNTRFSICYENVSSLPGYVTEKIFDCFFSGCIPIYWGANNINKYIPTDCFIDRRQFKDDEMVYRFLKSITEDEFKGYQERIVKFLSSEAAYPFSSEFFAKTVVDTIVQDLGY